MRAHNLAPFVISQPRWSLAQAPLGAHDLVDADEQIGWYQANKFPLAAYSPTAQGYFDGNDSATYQAPQNEARRQRARTLAQRYAATPGQVALAWLIGHAFPVFPILGTKNVERLKEALSADALQLTRDETIWLASG